VTAAQEWMRDPEFRAEYDALEDKFALASALVKAARRSAPRAVTVLERDCDAR
jgi:hypothetical protein